MRRSIILSSRILSFLKAVSPGPTIPHFWIGVRISLFHKHVYEMISISTPAEYH